MSCAATGPPKPTSSTSPAPSASATAASTATSPARPHSATPSPNAGSTTSPRPSPPSPTRKAPPPRGSERWLDLLVHSKRSKALERARALRHLHRAHSRGTRCRQYPRRHPPRTAHPDHRRRPRTRRVRNPRSGRLRPRRRSTQPPASTTPSTPRPGPTPTSTPPTKTSGRSSSQASHPGNRKAAHDPSRPSCRSQREPPLARPGQLRQPVSDEAATERPRADRIRLARPPRHAQPRRLAPGDMHLGRTRRRRDHLRTPPSISAKLIGTSPATPASRSRSKAPKSNRPASSSTSSCTGGRESSKAERRSCCSSSPTSTSDRTSSSRPCPTRPPAA